jgi:HK97 gp10 family phage protein
MARRAFFRVKVSGHRELKRELEAVPEKIQRKALRAGQTKASRIVIKEARAKVPVRFGLLKKSIGRRSKTYRKTGVVLSVIGPRRGFKKKREGSGRKSRLGRWLARRGLIKSKVRHDDPAKYAHLVEYGTVRSAPKPFLRPAYEHNRSRIIREQVEAIRRVLRKLGSR